MSLTYQEAVAFGTSPIGKRIPNMDKWLYSLERIYYNYGNAKPATRARNLAYYLDLVNQAKTNLPQAMERGLAEAVQNYLYAVRSYNLDSHPQYAAHLENRKNQLNDAVKLAAEVGVKPEVIVKSLEAGQGLYTDSMNSMIAHLRKSDKIWGIADNLILGALTGGLSPINAAALNSALAIANGADIKDALKAGLAGLGANQVGSYLQSVTGLVKDPTLNTALVSAAQSAAAATVLGQDVKTAALAGLAGGAVAGTLHRASDKAAISRAAGEYVQAIAAGYSPQDAMLSALFGFADNEMAEAKRQLDADPVVQKATKLARTEPIDDATPYRPQYGSATAALEGSEISGKPVTDVPVNQGDESFPRLFEKGDMRSPIGAAVSDLYEVKNKQGETFQARDITYQNGEVQRVIFDPTTGTYKQQMLKDLPSAGTATMPEMVITGEPDDGVNKPAQVLAFLKPQTKEFGSAIANLQSQDLLDLTNLLATGATSAKDSPFSADTLTNFQKTFSSAEAKAIELEKAATANPTPENIAAAKAAQNEAITAKFQLSQALIIPQTDLSKADLSSYNKYPDATNKFIDDGQVVYAKGAGTPDSPVEVLGSEPYVPSELKLFLPPSLPSASRPASPTEGVDTSSSDLADLQALSKIRGQPISQSLQMQMKSAKASANDALVALQSANTPETIKAARDALANYELSQKMYTQVAGEEPTDLPDEKLASQEFPLVDEAVKTGQMMGLSTILPANALTPLQRYQQYKRLSGQKEEENYLGDAGLGISVLPRFEGLMEPQMFARGGLTALRRM